MMLFTAAKLLKEDENDGCCYNCSPMRRKHASCFSPDIRAFMLSKRSHPVRCILNQNHGL